MSIAHSARLMYMRAALSEMLADQAEKQKAANKVEEEIAATLKARDPKTIERDWPGDVKRKNGNLQHVCQACALFFRGNRKRTVCWDCYSIAYNRSLRESAFNKAMRTPINENAPPKEVP